MIVFTPIETLALIYLIAEGILALIDRWERRVEKRKAEWDDPAAIQTPATAEECGHGAES